MGTRNKLKKDLKTLGTNEQRNKMDIGLKNQGNTETGTQEHRNTGTQEHRNIGNMGTWEQTEERPKNLGNKGTRNKMKKDLKIL